MIPSNRKPSAPGQIIRKEMSARSMSQTELAIRMDLSRYMVKKLLAGEKRISPDMAIKLSRVFCTSSELWMNLQNSVYIYMQEKNKNA